MKDNRRFVKLICIVAFVCGASGVFAARANNFSTHFVGNIGRYPVTAHLTRQGNTIYGYYGFNKDNTINYIGKKVWLDGLISDKNKFTLRTYPENAKNRQFMVGRIYLKKGRWELKGLWRSGNKKQAIFTLRNERLPLTGKVVFVSRNKQSHDKKLNAVMNISTAQQAKPNVIGHMAPVRAQFTNLSMEVVTKPCCFNSLTPIPMPLFSIRK